MYRTCCCVGYLTNPGGRCCMDFHQGLHGQSVTTDKIVIGPEPVAQGWQCPFCKRVYGPQVQSCDCQKRNKYTTITGGSTGTATGTVIR